MGIGLSKVLMYNALPIQFCAVINSPSRGWKVFDVSLPMLAQKIIMVV